MTKQRTKLNRSLWLLLGGALLGGISGIFAGSKGLSLLWPYALMQAGMNANKRIDTLAGHYGLFFCSCLLWLAAMFVLARFLLEKRDVKA